MNVEGYIREADFLHSTRKSSTKEWVQEAVSGSVRDCNPMGEGRSVQTKTFIFVPIRLNRKRKKRLVDKGALLVVKTKCLTKATKGRKGVFGLTVLGYSPSPQRNHGSRSLRHWSHCICSLGAKRDKVTFPTSFFFSLNPVLQGCRPYLGWLLLLSSAIMISANCGLQHLGDWPWPYLEALSLEH